MILKLTLGALSPHGPRRRLSILIFHRVLATRDALHFDLPDVSDFDRILTWIRRWFNVLPLDKAVEQLRSGSLPARAAAITFDDGYADNLTLATPVLRRHGVSATFFISTGFLDGGRMWNDTIAESLRACVNGTLDLRDLQLGRHVLPNAAAQRLALAQLLPKVKYLDPSRRAEVTTEIARRAGAVLPDDLMLTTSQLRQLRGAGMLIGAHTVTHPILARSTDAEAKSELLESKSTLESILQQPVTLFAYPNGKPATDYLARHADMVREAGFCAAVTTAPGAASAATDVFQLPRFTPWDRSPTRIGLRMARNLFEPVATAPWAA